MLTQAVKIKIVIIMRSFVWESAQFYLGHHCAQVSYTRLFSAYFAVEHVTPFKNPCFSRWFSEQGHYHILWTGPYRGSARSCFYPWRHARDAVMTNEKACYIREIHKYILRTGPY